MSIVKVVLLMEGGIAARWWTVLGPPSGERSKCCLSTTIFSQSRVTARAVEKDRRSKLRVVVSDAMAAVLERDLMGSSRRLNSVALFIHAHTNDKMRDDLLLTAAGSHEHLEDDVARARRWSANFRAGSFS